jgi:GAF domain-containing protein
MKADLDGPAELDASDIDALSAALASTDALDRVLGVVERISTQRMGADLFTASTCDVESVQVTRIHSSRPDAYPVGETTQKRQTSWGKQVLQQRRVFVGEGSLAMAAAFDDQAGMERLGVRSIINVPVVVKDRCLGILNFGFAEDRVSARALLLARLLGIVSAAAFCEPRA